MRDERGNSTLDRVEVAQHLLICEAKEYQACFLEVLLANPVLLNLPVVHLAINLYC